MLMGLGEVKRHEANFVTRRRTLRSLPPEASFRPVFGARA